MYVSPWSVEALSQNNISSNKMNVVYEMVVYTVVPLGNISRVVMISLHEIDEAVKPLYTVIDFM